MRIPVLLAFLFVVSHAAVAQDFTNKGKDFWIGYGNHIRMIQGSPFEKMQLYITSDVNTTGTVSIPSVGFSHPFNVTANQVLTVDIPRTAALLGEGIYNHGIHVSALKPVVVYSFIYVNSISGATVCLPTTTLGREYYSINYTQESNEGTAASSYFFAVAADTGVTTVEITPTRLTLGNKPAGVPFTVNLTQGQIINIMSVQDLTGSTIRSVSNGSGCKKLAVFSGSGKMSIGCASPGTSDNLYQQMYPTNTWGKSYLTVPSINLPDKKSQFNFFRIFKSNAAATVTLNGAPIPNGNFVGGLYADISATNVPGAVSSDMPIMVAQYFSTQGCAGNNGEGDPEMIFLNPVEQTLNRVTVYSMQPSTGTNIDQHFINVVMKNSPGALNTFKIDGAAFGSSFSPHPNAPGYVYAQIQVPQGAHNITCDTAFNALAYGFGDAESYGYSAGTNLKDLYQFVSIQNDYATVNFPAGCKGSPFKFAITFPYQPLQLKWVFGTALNDLGFADTVINNPAYDSSWVVSGRTLYRYRVNRSYTIPATGIYSITLYANNPTPDGCAGLQEINYDLQIFDRPSTDFSFTTTGCVTDSVAFFDNSAGMGRNIVRWNWDFGDATTGSLLNQRHHYTASGNITVKHSVITDLGCLSDTVTKTVAISDVPVAAFTTSAPLCKGQGVTFTNTSTIGSGGTIGQWNWDLGDGTLINATDGNAILHTFNTSNNYTASLRVQSSTGCSAPAFTQPVIVHDFPVAAFGNPKICLSDPIAEFTDSSTISDGTASQFTYLWQFGDPNNAGTSTLKNGQHNYTATGIYNVTLNVTSGAGCTSTATNSFTVNGSIPQAGFSVANATGLCSNTGIDISDSSRVDFGKIVRVDVYWDYGNDPTIKTVDDDPSTGKLYTHQYADFGTPATKTFQVRYVSYSGISCISEVTKTITVNASPFVQFDPVSGVCEEVAPFAITAAHEIYGFTGTGGYSGPGISADGQFDPALAKAGTHLLRYTFNSTNGCVAIGEQNIQVYPTPRVNAGPDRLMLEGGVITIDAAVTAVSPTFVWTPPVAIDNPNIQNPKVSPADDITYTLKVTTGDGCTNSDDMSVKVLKKIVVPNVFSPNGDGINDTWVIQYLESYPGATVEVYNRYGQLIYHSTGYTKPWDGLYNGQPVPVATYYWIINPRNGRKQVNGSVTVIR